MSGLWKQHLILLMVLGLPALVRAAEADFDAESKQAAEEDENEKKEREQGIKGKYQRKFFGTFIAMSATPDANVSSEVVGTFNTNSSDLKPGRAYLVKLEGKSKELLASLIATKGANVEVTGKLRNTGPDGEAKYIIASSCQIAGATPEVKKRNKRGGF